MWAELFCLSFYLYPMAASGTGVKRGNMDVRRRRTGRPAPLPLSGSSRCTTTPPHMRGRGGTPWGSSASQPPVEFRPYPPWVVGAGSGRSSRPQIGRWGRRQCHMPDFWVTGRPINPLNASAATFCAAGVISICTKPRQKWYGGVSGVSRGRFVTITTGSHTMSGRHSLSSTTCGLIDYRCPRSRARTTFLLYRVRSLDPLAESP
jgi:hypothetical protein